MPALKPLTPTRQQPTHSLSLEAPKAYRNRCCTSIQVVASIAIVTSVACAALLIMQTYPQLNQVYDQVNQHINGRLAWVVPHAKGFLEQTTPAQWVTLGVVGTAFWLFWQSTSWKKSGYREAHIRQEMYAKTKPQLDAVQDLTNAHAQEFSEQAQELEGAKIQVKDLSAKLNKAELELLDLKNTAKIQDQIRKAELSTKELARNVQVSQAAQQLESVLKAIQLSQSLPELREQVSSLEGEIRLLKKQKDALEARNEALQAEARSVSATPRGSLLASPPLVQRVAAADDVASSTSDPS